MGLFWTCHSRKSLINNTQWLSSIYPSKLCQWPSMHVNRELVKLQCPQPLLMFLITAVLFLLWHVKMLGKPSKHGGISFYLLNYSGNNSPALVSKNCTESPCYITFQNSCTHRRIALPSSTSLVSKHRTLKNDWNIARRIVVFVPQRCVATHSTNPYKGPLTNKKQFRFGLSSLLSPRATSLAAVSSTSLRWKLTPNVSSSGRPESGVVEGTATQKHKTGISGCEWR